MSSYLIGSDDPNHPYQEAKRLARSGKPIVAGRTESENLNRYLSKVEWSALPPRIEDKDRPGPQS